MRHIFLRFHRIPLENGSEAWLPPPGVWSQRSSHRAHVHLSHRVLQLLVHLIFAYLDLLRWVIDLRQPCALDLQSGFIFQSCSCNTISQSQTWWSQSRRLFCLTLLGRLPLAAYQHKNNFSHRKSVCFHCSSRMFDVPKRNKANLSVIFGRTVDKLLQQILENALNDFIHSWLRWVSHGGEVQGNGNLDMRHGSQRWR